MPSSNFENIFIANKAETFSELFDYENFRMGVFNIKSKAREGNDNEDALFVSVEKNILRIGVSDGAGGHPKGKEAAFEVADEVKTIDKRNMLEQVEAANNRVRGLKAGAMATLALAQINDDRVSFHTVGDSEVVYWNAQGREIYSSIPHSIVGAKIEAGVTTQKESLEDPERHIVTNMMGDEFVRIQSTSTFELKKGHTILVGSDGVFDNISHRQLDEIVAKGKFDDSFNEICEICTRQDPESWRKDDDITFVLLRKIRS